MQINQLQGARLGEKLEKSRDSDVHALQSSVSTEKKVNNNVTVGLADSLGVIRLSFSNTSMVQTNNKLIIRSYIILENLTVHLL